MAWCEECSQHLDTESVGADGTCPTCGRVIVETRRVPWYFKLLLLTTVIYVGWRLAQGIIWLVHHL